MSNRKQRRHHAGKPQGMTYADVLAQKRQVREAVDKAARDTTVQLEADTHTQRAMWLMVVSIHDAFGIGPDRMNRFFEALQENTNELTRMEEVDVEYAYEKLRHRAEACTGRKIEYLYEHEALAAELKHAKEAVKHGT